MSDLLKKCNADTEWTLYLDYLNNFLTVGSMCYHYGLNEGEQDQLTALLEKMSWCGSTYTTQED